MTPPGQDRLEPALNAVQTFIAEERDGDCSIVLFQNTPAQYHGRPEAAEEHTRELQQLASRGVVLG
ncbi:hypothetical protein [Cryptosporangium sp. NPDC048952]|uniref:hypothetical protein n=1 Tax=Cryptosporangium sp. NPDC048952 TaxID=3363961 RepID=UPI00371D8E56